MIEHLFQTEDHDIRHYLSFDNSKVHILGLNESSEKPLELFRHHPRKLEFTDRYSSVSNLNTNKTLFFMKTTWLFTYLTLFFTIFVAPSNYVREAYCEIERFANCYKIQ